MTTSHPTETGGLDPDTLRAKVLACWLGKAIGGTLGQTFEGNRSMVDADFYHPVPTGMVPNDDLDLQVVFACHLASGKAETVDRHDLARAWARHVGFPWNEYGIGLRNLAEGLEPPHTGSYDNWFTCGEGAAIRAELWACLAAGDPPLAAAYAHEDACFDHAGDGIAAARFIAAAEAAAFLTTDVGAVIDAGLSVIDPECELAHAVTDTRNWCADPRLSWEAIRGLIVQRYGRDDFTDVRPNTAFVILGLLRGRSFEERIRITTRCGLDTDSSTATVGSLAGILDPTGIPERWQAPIGRRLILNNAIRDLHHPADIDGFTDLVLALRERLSGRHPTPVPTGDAPDRPLKVELAWYRTRRLTWEGRDLSGLPPQGAPLPELEWRAATLPGSWVRIPAADFQDDLLAVAYEVTLPSDLAVRVMFNSTDDFRLWLDGTPVLAAQGSNYQFPAPHMPPVGQFWDGEVAAGRHRLVAMVRRPLDPSSTCEWVVAIAAQSDLQHVPWALRGGRPTDAYDGLP